MATFSLSNLLCTGFSLFLSFPYSSVLGSALQSNILRGTLLIFQNSMDSIFFQAMFKQDAECEPLEYERQLCQAHAHLSAIQITLVLFSRSWG